MSGIVKGCRTPAVTGRLRRAVSAGVGQASGEETAGEHTRRVSERGLWGFEGIAQVLQGDDTGSMTLVLGVVACRRRCSIAVSSIFELYAARVADLSLDLAHRDGGQSRVGGIVDRYSGLRPS